MIIKGEGESEEEEEIIEGGKTSKEEGGEGREKKLQEIFLFIQNLQTRP